ncbi:MAG: phospho-sugar mutase [Deltaproteobacteria bacterium]|nr:phospho-sugar mutase [Deltaproteobacteria bacterium]
MTIDDTLRAEVEAWMAEDPDEDTRAELEALLEAGDEAELRDRFRGMLSFGTAGLRGLLGGGPNRMNRAVVLRATAGFCAHLKASVPDAAERGVVIGFDGRRKSRVLANDAASVIAGMGLKALVFEEVAPTPLVAFALLDQKAAGALVITASHNPPDYNGYKVFWENGAQIIPPHDAAIAEAIGAVESLASIPRSDARTVLGDDVADRYLAGVKALAQHPESPRDLTIAHTALHGVGAPYVRRALADAGFEAVHEVASQREPDGTFPTVAFPNPEEKGAMDAVGALAKEVGADLVLANDPDADRLAVEVLHEGAYVRLTGNEIGCLLAAYLLEEGSGANRLVVESVVSSPMLLSIAKGHGIRAEQTLTGHKWIQNRALELEAEGLELVFGYEEALGYACGTLVRDKDGISAAAVMADLAAHCRARGKTVIDYREEAWRRYGLYLSDQVSLVLPGTEGAAQIQALMVRARKEPPTTLGGLAVTAVQDFETRTRTLADGSTEPLTFPAANVVVFEVEGGHRAMLRPSGTEPKLKMYFDVRVDVADGEAIAAAQARGNDTLAGIVGDFREQLGAS